MKLYNLLGDRQKVKNQYRSLIHMMKEEFSSKPDKEIAKWYENWLSLQDSY